MLEGGQTVTRITSDDVSRALSSDHPDHREVLHEDSKAFKAQEEHFRRLHPDYMAAEDQGRRTARRTP